MSDANVSVRINYAGPGGSTIAPSMVVVAPFDGSTTGQVDVAEGVLTGVDVDVPMGGIAAPNLIAAKNATEHDVLVTLAPFRLPPGGTLLYVAPVAPASAPLAAIPIETTTTQLAGGKIEYWVVGDPAEEE
jgi:hypothetical protein